MPDQYLATGHTSGEECSSTNEGRHINIEESLLTHPTHADGLVDGGDPVIIPGANGNGNIVGVAFSSASAATELVAIDTEGIWFLSVVASDDAGNSAVEEGEMIYINTTTAVLSKIANWATQIPFGRSLGDVAAGTTGVCAVKVHCDPPIFNALDNFVTCTDGDYAWSIKSYLAGGASEGLNGYVEGHLTAATTGHLYGYGSWINIDDEDLCAAGNIIVPFEGGIYAGDDQPNGRIVFAGQYQSILSDPPASLHAWRLNSTQDITALVACANPGTAGYQVGTAGTGVVGTAPLYDVVGHGVLYVDLHAGVA